MSRSVNALSKNLKTLKWESCPLDTMSLIYMYKSGFYFHSNSQCPPLRESPLCWRPVFLIRTELSSRRFGSAEHVLRGQLTDSFLATQGLVACPARSSGGPGEGRTRRPGQGERTAPLTRPAAPARELPLTQPKLRD